MRIVVALIPALVLLGCGDPTTPDAPVPPPAPEQDSAAAPDAPVQFWSRISSDASEVLRLEENGELVAQLACLKDGARLEASSDRLAPISSEERFTIGAGDEAFTLVADPGAGRPRGVLGAGAIPADFLARIEAGEPVAFNYGAHNLGPFPPIPETEAKAFSAACRSIAG